MLAKTTQMESVFCAAPCAADGENALKGHFFTHRTALGVCQQVLEPVEHNAWSLLSLLT